MTFVFLLGASGKFAVRQPQLIKGNFCLCVVMSDLNALTG